MSQKPTHDSSQPENYHDIASDMFVMRFLNPHTAIPDWLILSHDIRQEVRHMAAVIMVLNKRPMPPTQDDIAEALEVERRTVQRWLAECRDAGILSYRLIGRRRMYVFHEPLGSPDPTVDDPTVGDRMRSGDRTVGDRAIVHDSPIEAPSLRQHRQVKRLLRQNPISDRAGGGGDHDSPGESNQPTNPPLRSTKVLPTQITTDTGRWMVKTGFNIVSAYRFQSIPLDVAQADYARRRDLGQQHGAIINAWRVELPQHDALHGDFGPQFGSDRIAALNSKYGDLFRSGSDMTGLEDEQL